MSASCVYACRVFELRCQQHGCRLFCSFLCGRGVVCSAVVSATVGVGCLFAAGCAACLLAACCMFVPQLSLRSWCCLFRSCLCDRGVVCCAVVSAIVVFVCSCSCLCVAPGAVCVPILRSGKGSGSPVTELARAGQCSPIMADLCSRSSIGIAYCVQEASHGGSHG